MKHLLAYVRAKRGGWLAALAALLVCSGAAVAARPAYRAGRRHMGAIWARHLWRQADTASPIAPGAPAGWLTMPQVGIDTLIIHDAGRDGLHRFPCLPAGDDPITIIMAHRDTHFRPLARVAPGMRLSFTRPGETAREYEIVETEILEPGRAENRLEDKAHEDWLVLVTCHPFRYVGPAPRRFLAWARPRSQAGWDGHMF